jgi:hypothetical protein
VVPGLQVTVPTTDPPARLVSVTTGVLAGAAAGSCSNVSRSLVGAGDELTTADVLGNSGATGGLHSRSACANFEYASAAGTAFSSPAFGDSVISSEATGVGAAGATGVGAGCCTAIFDGSITGAAGVTTTGVGDSVVATVLSGFGSSGTLVGRLG